MASGSRTGAVLVGIVGFIVGLAAALYIAWEIWPIEPVPSSPAQVRREYVPQYMILIASQYSQDGDLQRAISRLYALGVPGVEQALAEFTNQYIAKGGDLPTIRALVQLCDDLGVSTSGMVVYLRPATPTPLATWTPPAIPTPTATLVPIETALPMPTGTPSPTVRPAAQPTLANDLTPRFALKQRLRRCDEAGEVGVIRIYLQDAEGRGYPGVPIVVSWESGEETFYTGLKPEVDAGYADFELREVGLEYYIVIPPSPDPASEVTTIPEAAGCLANQVVSWQLTFIQSQ